MKPRSSRVLTATLAVCLAALAMAPAAAAEDVAEDVAEAWVLVIDADEAEAASPKLLPAEAQALLQALKTRETATRLLAARHPVLALTKAIGKAGERAALVVVFVGAFAELPKASDAALEKARTLWAADAPAGSRLLALEGIAEAGYAALEGLDGLAAGGTLVVGFGEPRAEAAPFSPLDPEGALRATITVPVERLALAGGEAGGDLLAMDPDNSDDRVAPGAPEAKGLRFELTRSLTGSRSATCTFRDPGDARAVLVTPPPEALTWTWDRLLADTRIQAADGGAAGPIDATGTEADTPRELRYRVLLTKPAQSTLEPRVHVDGSPRPVAGLRAWIEGTAARDDEVVEAGLHVRYAPQRATPQDVRGEIRLNGRAIPFHVSADVGRATLRATPPDRPFALPLSRERRSVQLRVEPGNGNMPTTTAFELRSEPEAYADRVRLRVFGAKGTEWRVVPGGRLELPTGTPVEVVVELRDLDAWAALEPGTLHIRPADQDGVVVEGALALPYRFRQAHLVRSGDAPRYRVTDGRVQSLAPLRLTLEADGGDGAWLLARLQSTPRVTERGSAPLSDWVVVEEGSGTWRVEAQGTWRGLAPKPFAAAEAGVTFDIAWSGGGVPGEVSAAVEVPPRWGTRGWIFVVLAALAIALAVGTFLQLRPAAIRGTLLYAVQGLDRTVGRVDLSPVGRRATVLRADARGRVTIAGEGDPIATIRPTRVGAMLDVPGPDGEPDRRLLVDGLSVQTGRHTLRYVSGDAEDVEAAIPALEVPDLLGPEFDLESGAMDALPETTG